MYNIKVNDKFSFQINSDKGKTYVNDQEVIPDLNAGQDQHVHILLNNKSYRTEIVEFNRQEKSCTIKVNGNTYILDIRDQYDELLHQLGLDTLNKVKIAELKAPMPGLVLRVMVKEGDEVMKGENLLVLEAMKMKNLLRSPRDGTVASVDVNEGQRVPFGAVIIRFA